MLSLRRLSGSSDAVQKLLGSFPAAQTAPASPIAVLHLLGRCQSSSGTDQAAADAPHLTATDLHYSAKLARLSGLCYGTPDRLAARLQAEGLQVEAQGQTSFTRWEQLCRAST